MSKRKLPGVWTMTLAPVREYAVDTVILRMSFESAVELLQGLAAAVGHGRTSGEAIIQLDGMLTAYEKPRSLRTAKPPRKKARR
jgi:hypothetical protein